MTRKKREQGRCPQQPGCRPGQDGPQDGPLEQVKARVVGTVVLAPDEDAYHHEGKDNRRRPGNNKVNKGQGQVVSLAEPVGVGRGSEGLCRYRPDGKN